MGCSNYILKLTGLSMLALMGSRQLKAQNVALEWVDQFTCTGGYSKGEAITTDGDGNVYITGAFGGTVDFDPGVGTAQFTAQGTTDIFVCKYNAAGTLVWAKVMGGSVESDRGRAITLDKEGNVYTTGIFYGTADFDPGPNFELLTSASLGWADVFISKLDKDGNFVWAKSLGGPDPEDASTIAFDTAGNLLIYGSYSGTVDFDPGTGIHNVTSAMPSGFVLKLDTKGDFSWVKSIGGPGMALPTAMALGASGNIYLLTTIMGGDVDFDPGAATYNISPTGFPDYCVSKLDGNGNFIWAKQIGGLFTMAMGTRMGLDSKENVIATGFHMGGPVDFDPGPNTHEITSKSAAGDVFVSKLDSAGNFVWVSSTESYGKSGTEPYGLAIDHADNIFTTGYFKEKIDYDPGAGTFDMSSRNYDTAATHDVFIWKLKSDGSLGWAKQLGGKGLSIGNAVTVDAQGSVYTTGSFADDCDFDPNGKGTGHVLTTEAKRADIFLHKMICTDTNSSQLDVTSDCDGYEFYGTRYTQSGTYYTQLINTSGCDSTIALNLTVTPLSATISVEGYVLSTTETYTSYQWMLNGNIIEGATGDTYTVPENGNYQVIVTSDKGCTDTSDIYVVNNVSIDKVQHGAAVVSIYPNPASTSIYVRTAEAAVQILLSDVTGKVLVTEHKQRTLSLGQYAPGVYFVTVKSLSGSILKIEKIVKQ